MRLLPHPAVLVGHLAGAGRLDVDETVRIDGLIAVRSCIPRLLTLFELRGFTADMESFHTFVPGHTSLFVMPGKAAVHPPPAAHVLDLSERQVDAELVEHLFLLGFVGQPLAVVLEPLILLFRQQRGTDPCLKSQVI